jgi:hypothetical protein
MAKHEWTVISSDDFVSTAVMEVPGGVVMRYRMYSEYDAGPAVSLVFIPGAKITDFTPETEEVEEE